MKYLIVIYMTLILATIAKADEIEKEVDMLEQIVMQDDRIPAHGPDSPFRDSDIERTLKDGTKQKFDGDDYKIVPRHQKKKVVKKKPKKDDCGCKNRASLLVGHGALGNLRANGNRVETENGAVFGAQLMRDYREDGYHLLIQVQSNETVSIGAGFDF